MSKIHEVKTMPEYFWIQVAGCKTFEVRYNDRGYKAGDILRQKEWSPYGGYTGAVLDREITYVMDNPEFCKEGFVVLGLKEMTLNSTLAHINELLGAERDGRLMILPPVKVGWLKAILAERERQDQKWGCPQENTYCEWASILAEETGELAKELNELNFGRGDPGRMTEEAVQVAAVALSILEQATVAHGITMQAAIALGRLTRQEASAAMEGMVCHGQSEAMEEDQKGSKGE